MRFYNAVLLVALVTLLAGSSWRVQGQIVGADCVSRGPDVCRECCAEKFQLGTIKDDRSCTTPECSPLESALTGPAPEPAAAEPVAPKTKPAARAKPVPSPVPEAATSIVPDAEAVASAVESAVENAADAAARQADAIVDNAQARDAGVMASVSFVFASVFAILLL